jgi:hypothetical protein
MKKIATILILLIANNLFAQNDLLKMMEEEAPSKPTPVFATFKSTRLVNLHTNEQMKAKHLDFRIQHRFQPMQIDKENVYGLYNMFGIDGAVMRLGFEYGVTDKLMIGLGRSNIGKTYDLMAKYKILQQTRGKKSMPVSVNYFGNIGINTLEFSDKTRNNFFTSRLSFVNQLIITRKFNDYVSVAISPSMVHQNLVENKSQSHDIYALGLGASIKISRSARFNFEYIPRLNARNEKKLDGTLFYDAFAFGLDIETGGHVFQLHFTNGAGLIEQQFISQNTNKLTLNSLRFGFNLSRVFSLEKEGQ